MNMRGDEHTRLKFWDHPMYQAMGILAGKFMNEQNFKHLTFGPMLETYSQECLRNDCAPTVPYILSYNSSWFDTSSRGTITERDLYAIKYTGRTMKAVAPWTSMSLLHQQLHRQFRAPSLMPAPLRLPLPWAKLFA